MELAIIEQVSQFGLLGMISALVWWIAMQLWRDLKMSWQERITESKQLVSLTEMTNSSYVALAAATEKRAASNEAMSQAQEATSKALHSHTRALERFSQTNQQISGQLERLTIDLEKIRDDLTSLRSALDKNAISRTRK